MRDPRLRSSSPRLTCSMRAFLTCSPTQAHWEPTTWLAPISVSTEGCDSAETSPLAAEALPAHQLPCFPLAVQPVHSWRKGRQESRWSSSFSVSLYYAAPCLPLLSLGAWRPAGGRGTHRKRSRRKGRGSIENTQTLGNYMWAPVYDSSAETSSHTLLLTRLNMGLGTAFANTWARTSRGSWGCLNTAAPSFRTESLPGCPGSIVLLTWPLAHRTSMSWRGPGQSSYNQDDFA